jgi:hypothetical protein
MRNKYLCINELLFKQVLELSYEPLAICITIWQDQNQESIFHVGQNDISLLTELQGNLSRFMGGTVG